ncbi:MAG: FtsX-like permease family protein [Tannerellaceae bacterium]
MKQLTVIFRYLAKARGNNIIKLLSLTFGLAIALVLFARITFDLSYDRFLPEADQIYQVQTVFTTGAGTDKAKAQDYNNTFQPVAPTMAVEIPGVEAGTSIFEGWEGVIFRKENKYTVRTIMADTMFFRTLPFPILAGDPQALSMDNHVFISEGLARRIFKEQNPIGETLFEDKMQQKPLTVCGIFQDVPENCHLESFTMIRSIAGFSRNSWNGGDGYTGYVRLQPGVSMESINKAIPQMLARHMDMEAMKKGGFSFTNYIKPLVTLHMDNGETKRNLIVLTVLATLILIAVSLNYVMISISSLATRARTIGIYKCNGSTSAQIFMMLMQETIIITIAALLLSGFFILLFQDEITLLTGVSLTALFAPQQLKVATMVILFVVLLSGVIPSCLFARIPVTQVFRLYYNSKRIWRQVLLCLQFASAAFMLAFLVVILMQYNQMLNKDLGYEPDNLAYSTLYDVPIDRQQTIKAELLRSPDVVGVTFSSDLLCSSIPGTPLSDPQTKEVISTVRFFRADSDYIHVMGMHLTTGSNIPNAELAPAPTLVSQMLVDKMRWKDSPIGKVNEDFGIRVAGVLSNYVVNSLYEEQYPILLMPYSSRIKNPILTLRLREITPEVLTKLNNQLSDLLPEQEILLSTYRDTIHEKYTDVEHFRRSVAIASLFMLLITLLGLLGYVSDEIERRSKEIAVRKVNGATAGNILFLITKNIIRFGIPSLLIGLIGAYVAAEKWLQQFAEKVELSPMVLLLGALALLLIILATVFLRSWSVANENPVERLKNE